MNKAAADRADTQPCAVCGRTITWRKKWERSWPEIRYCSDACRRRSKSQSSQAIDGALEGAILALLAERGRGKTICPSEAARRVAPDVSGSSEHGSDEAQETWQLLMEPARAAARRLHAAGRLRILQRGHPVDPSRARGPIRLQLVETPPLPPSNASGKML
jgi:hypothetical protein